MTGLPLGKRKSPKKVRRGGKHRKPSGNPLNQHASALARAHAAGNYGEARTHALNYANASMASAKQGSPMVNPAEGVDDMGGGTFIAGAIKHPGALHRELGVPQGQKIPAAKIAKAAHSDDPTLARRARLAQTLKKLRPK